MITVRFFASLRDAVGDEQLALAQQLVAQDLDSLLEVLRERFDECAYQAITANSVRVAVNQTLVEGNQPLSVGDEVAFLPAVTGG